MFHIGHSVSLMVPIRARLEQGLKSSEVMKELGRRWSSLGDAGQAPYIAQALKAKSNAPPPPTGTEPVLRVKGEAQIAKLAVTASNAAIEGFFAGLTEMTEAELASNMSMKNVGSLKMVHVDGTVVLTFKPRKPTGEGSPPKK